MFYYVGVTAYISVIGILFCVFYIKNGFSFSLKKSDTDLSELSNEELEKLSRSGRTARRALKILAPMVLSVLLSYAELIFSDYIQSIIK